MPGPRADHVGSLLRPRPLLEARAAHAAGKLTTEELRAAEDAAVLHVLALQQSAGLTIFTDGEFRRSSWLGGVRDTFQGLERSDAIPRPAQWKGPHQELANSAIPVPQMVVTGKLCSNGRFTETETKFLKAHAPGPFKITMPSPTLLMHLFLPGVTDKVYKDRVAMLDDLVEVYRSEIDAQIADGAAYIQLDSLRYIDFIDERRRNAIPKADADRTLGEIVACDNAVLARAKGRAIRGVHICRGNHRSAWAAQGGYEPLAERLFAELDTDRFLLEFDDERSGGFAPLRFVPKGKTVVLGLITTKSGALENVDDLLRRIDEASKYVPLEYLALGPQCGFASTELGNLLTEDEEKKKLELAVTTAERIWGTA